MHATKKLSECPRVQLPGEIGHSTCYRLANIRVGEESLLHWLYEVADHNIHVVCLWKH